MTTISQDTLAFLTALARNNHRRWFEDHRVEYEAARADFATFGQEIAEEVAAFDGAVRCHLDDPKTVKFFRIYRDVRFAKDKQPYKQNFGMAIAAGGTGSGAGVYYLHLEPRSSFVGGGLYMPPADRLAEVRARIARDPAKLRAILAARKFRSVFGTLDDSEMLKKTPRGYDADHPAAVLLRYKSFTAGKEISDSTVTSKDFAREVVALFKALKPLNDYFAGV